MTASEAERDAVIAFLTATKHARDVRRRLFERVEEEPELVILYLDSLPEGVEAEDDLLQQLRKAANLALPASKSD